MAFQRWKHQNSHRRCSLKKGVLKNYLKFTGKHPCQSLFANKVSGLIPATLLTKTLWHRCFPVNFVNILRTTFSQNASVRLLLKHQKNVQNLFKVNIEDNRIMSLISFWHIYCHFWTDFTHWSHRPFDVLSNFPAGIYLFRVNN